MPLFNPVGPKRRMPADRLARLSHRMAGITLVVMAALLGLNVLNWIYPPYGPHGYGFSFGLTARWLANDGVDVSALPAWQTLGAIVISSVPLLALIRGLTHLRALFRSYADGAYFSMDAARRLGTVGNSIAWWVAAEFLTEPALSLWVTLREGPGKHLIVLSLDAPALVALFVAACVAVIGRILQRACEVYQENQQFV